ncbi:MAG: prolipoprotein diacylglyceryl transferase [Saezia sp.]
MLVHPQFDPVALSIGPLSVHWYGLMYLLAFALFWICATQKIKQPHIAVQRWTRKDIEDLLFYGVLGVVLGARLGYVFFYKPAYYLSNPSKIFAMWEGGMSFHGGFIGVLVVVTLFAFLKKKNWLDLTDMVAPCIPIGLAAGRLGNFINGELWGRVTDSTMPWIMAFPQSGSMLPRHPSQLYQCLLEGLLLFVILWVYSKKPHGRGAVSAMFLIGYGAFRFIVEYFREPDAFLGLQALNLSRGQWLCVPMILAGIILLLWAYRKNGRTKIC